MKKPIKILIMGLPGSGKTTLGKKLAEKINAVHFNADEIREHINKELKFSLNDRIEHARRMGWLCDQVIKAGHNVVADFVCPTLETRDAFNIENSYVIYMNTIEKGRFEDTNKMFVTPTKVNYEFTKWYDVDEMVNDLVLNICDDSIWNYM